MFSSPMYVQDFVGYIDNHIRYNIFYGLMVANLKVMQYNGWIKTNHIIEEVKVFNKNQFTI